MIFPFTLWLFNIAMENGPFIDGLPIKNGWIFHGYVSHNQRIKNIIHESYFITSHLKQMISPFTDIYR